MRIISGKFKNKKIIQQIDEFTRPLKDITKESIFNILLHSKFIKTKIENSRVLDLFSGSGSFGLECISRGAEKITFVEKDKNAAEILKKNLINLGIKKNATVIIDKIDNFLKKDLSEKFEIIFLDPPFADESYLQELKSIKENKNFKKNHLIIIHRERKSFENFKDILSPIVTKQYGRSKIIFGKFLR